MTSPSKNHVSPLHNFGLPSLWTTEGASSLHRRRQITKSRAQSPTAASSVTPPPPQRRQVPEGKQAVVFSSPKDGDCEEEVSLVEVAAGLCGSPVEEFNLRMEEALRKDKATPLALGVGGIKIGDKKPKSKPEASSGAQPGSSNKILIKLPKPVNKDGKGKAPVVVEEEKKGKDSVVVEEGKVDDGLEEEEEEGVVVAEDKAGEGEEEVVKSGWNLRPRNKIKAKNCGEASEKGKGVAVGEKKGGVSGGEKKEKKKLTINVALTKREIEEDLFAFGIKPARRPKKRTKQVQMQLDRLYPGNNLVNISADSYHVSLNSLKKKQG